MTREQAASTENLLKQVQHLCFDRSGGSIWRKSSSSEIKTAINSLLHSQAVPSGPSKHQQLVQSVLISKVGPCRICGTLLTVASIEEHLALNHTYCCKDCSIFYVAKKGTAHPGCKSKAKLNNSELVCCETFHPTLDLFNTHLSTHTAADFFCKPCNRWFGSVDACRQHTRDSHKRPAQKATSSNAADLASPTSTTPAPTATSSQASAGTPPSSADASAPTKEREQVSREPETHSSAGASSPARVPFLIPDLSRYPVLSPSRSTEWTVKPISAAAQSSIPVRPQSADPFVFLLDAFNFPSSSDLIDIKSVAAWT